MPARKSGHGRRPSARLVLAAEAARLRKRSGRSLEELAAGTACEAAYLRQLESGERLGTPAVFAALDAMYGTGGHLVELWELARDTVFRERFRRFMELERRAVARHEYAAATVPGLFQTEEYAREQLRTARLGNEQELEEQAAARVGRQGLLVGDTAPRFVAVLDEAVLRRRLRDPASWRRQLQRLLDVSRLPRVSLQVLPFASGLQHLLGSSLTVLWMPDGSTVAYTEGAWSGELVEEGDDVDRLRLSCDVLRDSALPPDRSAAFVRRLMDGTEGAGGAEDAEGAGGAEEAGGLEGEAP
ncbi:helix-turn-helix transcriptional regulator [Streptomyces sp. WMMB 322]|uniref:helix-turn-helix domain-containing protein n=1 Tax=Streptomyces sp. WMMB 322 TaxID=1286821 RepID=UPI0006E3A716|nr:helix-turn-helix transcriptional regulator [Streptomyces sp. WMMB 322]SCK26348.1 Helix-turn-helix domain-containing protein [Streptomyces sp. WMMB 322]